MAGNGESDRGGVKIARETLGGENGLPLEEIPFTFVMDEGNQISDGESVQCRKGKSWGWYAHGSRVASSINNWAKFSLRGTPVEVTECRCFAFLCK